MRSACYCGCIYSSNGFVACDTKKVEGTNHNHLPLHTLPFLAGDALWLGRNNSRLPAVLSAIAGALVAHNANMMANGDKGEDHGGDDDEEDDDEEDDEAAELISEESLVELRAAFERLKATPAAAAQLVPIVRGMKKAHKAALAVYGLV